MVNGFAVARVGLCGDAAYEVDGVPMAREEAELFAVPLPRPVAARPRRRARPAPRPAPAAIPELLADVRSLVRGRDVHLEHRRFTGGEAVTITPKRPGVDLEAVRGAVVAGGLHAEWGAGGDAIVAAASRSVLAPEPKKKGVRHGLRAA